MRDLYVFFLTVIFPVGIKYLFFEEDVDPGISLGLYGLPNEFTVPIIKVINNYKLPCMIVVKKEELNSYPFALQNFIKQSEHYKFVPYIEKIEDLDAIPMLNTSLIISPYRFSIANRSVVSPNYYGPLLKSYKDNITLWTRVWTDLRDDKIKGYMLFPYTEATLNMMEEYIHDLIRFEKTINTKWYSL